MDIKAYQQLKTIQHFQKIDTAQSNTLHDDYQPHLKVKRRNWLMQLVIKIMGWFQRKTKVEHSSAQGKAFERLADSPSNSL